MKKISDSFKYASITEYVKHKYPDLSETEQELVEEGIQVGFMFYNEIHNFKHNSVPIRIEGIPDDTL